MDLPVELTTNPKWVYNKDELRQDVIALLCNNIGMFIQSPDLGRSFDVHLDDNITVDECVRATLSRIKGIYIASVEVNLPMIRINIEYNGENLDLEYKIES